MHNHPKLPNQALRTIHLTHAPRQGDYGRPSRFGIEHPQPLGVFCLHESQRSQILPRAQEDLALHRMDASASHADLTLYDFAKERS